MPIRPCCAGSGGLIGRTPLQFERKKTSAVRQPVPEQVPTSDFWVFGYGSLMWRPGFDHLQAAPARIAGLHRSLCVYSWVHRGTEKVPGLVLGLDRGGSCRGIAYRVAGADRDGVIAYLRERELVTAVYLETWRKVRLEGAAQAAVDALTFIVDRSHRQYAGNLPREDLLRFVRQGRGRSGANADYVVSTVRHLRSVGVADPTLEWLADRLEA
jgi:cation transport protein ChaC